MKINQLFLVVVAGVLLASCQGPGKVDADQQIKTCDSAAGLVQQALYLTEKFKTVNAFPYVADTTVMFNLETCDSMGTKEVKLLDTSWFVRDSLLNESYNMADFYRIDSIKASGNYAVWCDSLSIGMTKGSNACALGKIRVDEKTVLLVWGLATSSYEACPYTSTRSVYVSIVKNGVVSQTFKLSEYISSVDPPVAMQRISTGVINQDLTVDVNLYEEDDEDMDQPEISITKEAYRYAIKDGKVSLVSVKKEAPVKVRRKK